MSESSNNCRDLNKKINKTFSENKPDQTNSKCPFLTMNPKDSICIQKLKRILPNKDEAFVKDLQKQMNSEGFTREDQVLFLGQTIPESKGFELNEEIKNEYEPYPQSYLDRQYLLHGSKEYKLNEKKKVKKEADLKMINEKLNDPKIKPKEKAKLEKSKDAIECEIEKLYNKNKSVSCRLKKVNAKLNDNEENRITPKQYDEKIDDKNEDISSLKDEIHELKKVNNKAYKIIIKQKESEIKRKEKEISNFQKKKTSSEKEIEKLNKAKKEFNSTRIDNKNNDGADTSNCSDMIPSDYKGRGGIQLTGESNYNAYFEDYNKKNGTTLKVDNANDVASVASPPHNSASAVWYYKTKNIGKVSKHLSASDKKRLNELKEKTDKSPEEAKEYNDLNTLNMSYIVNGKGDNGYPNGYNERKASTDKIRGIANESEPCRGCTCT